MWKKGRIVRVSGGAEARIFERWIKSFSDEKMFGIAHLSYGCNPGAKLTGNILEDERVWGIGSQSSSFKGKLGLASSHTDGICLNPTLTIDGEKIIQDGGIRASILNRTNDSKISLPQRNDAGS